jgi:hypothetical protein
MRRFSTKVATRWSRAVLSVAIWVVPATARAQLEPDVETLIQRGVQARKEARDAEALQDFQRAYEAMPSPRALGQIALAEQALGQWVQAEKHLLGALQAADDPWIERHRPALEAALDEVRNQLASVEVSCDAAGGDLWLNGARIGSLPLPAQRVTAGPVLVEVRGDGFDLRQVVALEPRKSLQVTLSVKRGERRLAGPPTAPEAVALSPDVRKPLASNDTARRPPSVRPIVAWTLLASGGALLAGAVVAHVVRETSLAIYNNDTRCFFGPLSRGQRCGTYLGEAQVAGDVAIAAYAGAALTLGASAYCFVTSSPGAPAPMTPGGRRLGFGLAYGGRF